jgi:hypothetical protein
MKRPERRDAAKIHRSPAGGSMLTRLNMSKIGQATQLPFASMNWEGMDRQSRGSAQVRDSDA